jgi:hypothetical protein
MTRALVVYESMFGNTQTIAQTIAEGLSSVGTVDLVEVGAAPTSVPGDIDLLVVGAPTHAFGLSRPGTRKSAADQAVDGIVSTGIGVREWLDALRTPHPAAAVAAFDTRVKVPLLPGSAARRVLKRLRGFGFTVVDRPQSFFVVGTPGPLRDGEVEHARLWGAHLAAVLVARRYSV